MALTKYTNVDQINARTTGTGKFLKDEDLFVITQDSTEPIKFGDCELDVMEVTLYDINGNILPQKEQTIRYIRYDEIDAYLIKTDTDEIAIDVEKILRDAEYKNGIFRVNVAFTRLKVGDESKYRRLWIQDISATRNEIRALPLVVQDDEDTTYTNDDEFTSLQNLDTDTITYKEHLEKILATPNTIIRNNMRDYITNAFPAVPNAYDEFIRILYSDFWLRPEYLAPAPSEINGKNQFEANFIQVSEEVLNGFKQKVQKKIERGVWDSCESINRLQADTSLMNELRQEFQRKANTMRLENVQSSVTLGGTDESMEENLFEVTKNISAATIDNDTSEYTEIDLSDIKFNTETLDDFEALQRRISLKMTPSSTSTTSTTSTPVPATPTAQVTVPLGFWSITESYSTTTGINTTPQKTACQRISSGGIFQNYIIDTTSFETATSIKLSTTGQLANTGYYSDGTWVRFWKREESQFTGTKELCSKYG